jgi:hypothetical protein
VIAATHFLLGFSLMLRSRKARTAFVINVITWIMMIPSIAMNGSALVDGGGGPGWGLRVFPLLIFLAIPLMAIHVLFGIVELRKIGTNSPASWAQGRIVPAVFLTVLSISLIFDIAKFVRGRAYESAAKSRVAKSQKGKSDFQAAIGDAVNPLFERLNGLIDQGKAIDEQWEANEFKQLVSEAAQWTPNFPGIDYRGYGPNYFIPVWVWEAFFERVANSSPAMQQASLRIYKQYASTDDQWIKNAERGRLLETFYDGTRFPDGTRRLAFETALELRAYSNFPPLRYVQGRYQFDRVYATPMAEFFFASQDWQEDKGQPWWDSIDQRYFDALREFPEAFEPFVPNLTSRILDQARLYDESTKEGEKLRRSIELVVNVCGADSIDDSKLLPRSDDDDSTRARLVFWLNHVNQYRNDR